ncbi:hypothetical protein RCO28_11525 [Streptomyces sp. LHD-70]|uniref:hypothetical protein n=1 Tax=Streptomyces sp. LHD-70 TaxID=3072140 RepID=UPI00280F8FC4|nr:hypothetical protein [Streptomyces sp. LHD-70]MDQ8703116.1 hypothetical protein [Streptomyces sp. LHD-70]
MSTDARSAGVPPRPSSPPPPNPSTRLPDEPPRTETALPIHRTETGAPVHRADAGQRPEPAEPTPPQRPNPPAGAPVQPSAPASGPATPAVPPLPTGDAGMPSPSGTGRIPAQPAPPAAPAPRPSETTARLRPVPPAPGEQPARRGGSAPLPPETPRHPQPPPRPAEPPRPAPRRRPVGSVDLSPQPGAGRPIHFGRPAVFDDRTARLRPVPARTKPRLAAVAACLVLGFGLIGGAVTGSWLTGEADGAPSSERVYSAAGAAWHNEKVDTLFPPRVKGDGAGPGGADRVWTRIAVAPDSGCKTALDPLLRKALQPAGCERLLRATYTDATRSYVTTVGMIFTRADAPSMGSLRTRFTEEGLDQRDDLMPRPYAKKGTVAASFGDEQRASWTVSVLTDAPVVVYAVSGFADGREVSEPEPAAEAMESGATSAPAQSGLGHEAKGLTDQVERALRKTAKAASEEEPS